MTHGIFPPWLHSLASVSLALAVACAAVISVDEIRRRQRMWIMNLVWPITALFGSVLWLVAYYVWGREQQTGRNSPFPVVVGKGTSHCGAGCTLGDLVAEWTSFAFP